MSLKAHIRTDSMGNITVHMEGGLDFENTATLQRELESLTYENPTSTITLDLNRLDFVGSSGIGIFIDTVKIMNDKKDLIRLANVSTEFMKVFKLYGHDALETIIAEFDNDDTEMLSQNFANRKTTFQN